MTLRDQFSSQAYLAIEAARLGGHPMWLNTGDGVAPVPIIARDIAGTNGLRDGVSPYGYPVFGRQTVDERLIDAAREAGIVSLYLRLSPGEVPPIASRVDGHVVEVGEVVDVDTSLPVAELTAGFRKQLRYDLRRQDGRYALRGRSDTDGVGTFHAMYCQTMDRLGAAASYYFDRDYLKRLVAIDGVSCQLLFEDDQPVAGAIVIDGPTRTYYHLGGTRKDKVRDAPSKSLLRALIERAAAQGVGSLVLGGGMGGADDGLMTFKRGFSRRTTMVRAVRLVTEADAYAKLAGPSARDIGSGYFPAYRAAA